VVENIKKNLNFKFNKEALAKLDMGVSENAEKASQEFDKSRQPGGPNPVAPIDPAKMQEAIKNAQQNPRPAPATTPAPVKKAPEQR
jgi:hypothetical protein